MNGSIENEKSIDQMVPWYGEEERSALIEYLDSGGWLTEFSRTREFERMVAEYTGSRYCSVLCNGTVTLYVALLALGIGRDDEVLVPDFTMIASANAVVMAGAKPVFVDIDRRNLCMDLALAAKAITSKTKALMIVSLNGRHPDMEAARKLAREHDLVIVEDAAQSLGSRSAGKHLGTFGDVGSFSFSAPKVITTGQGGALITDSEDLMEKIRRIKDFGRSRGGIDEHEVIGFNFKFTDLQAVVGIEQMKKLEWRVDRKKEIFALYRDELAGVRQVEFIETDLDDTSPWFIDVLVPEREDLRSFLKSKGIGSRPFYPPIHRQAAYAIEGNYPVSEEVSAHGLWLPSSSSLRDEDVDRICREMSMFFSPSS